MTIEDYNFLSEEQRNNFIELINNQIDNHKGEAHYSIFHRSRKTNGQVILGAHQPSPGRLTAIDELKRSDTKNRKVYLLCLCDCGKWHICRSDAYKKNTTNGGCHSCGCLNNESLSKTIYNKEVQQKRIENLKDYLKDKGVQVNDNINEWVITQVKTEPSEVKHGTRKYAKGICPYCKKESQWIRADGIQNGAVHSCGCASEFIGEQTVRRLLENNNISFEQEKTFKDCISPTTNSHFRFDFYVNNKYLIEFDGKQHYVSDSRFFQKKKSSRYNTGIN